MRLILKQNYISFWHPGYLINAEEDGATVFKVSGQLSIFQKLEVEDLQQNVHYIVKHRYFRFPARNDIVDKDGKLLYKCKRTWNFFARNHKVTNYVNGDVYKIKGGFWGYDFMVSKNGEPFVTIKKKLISLRDVYYLETLDDDMESLALASAFAIVIDCAHHGMSRMGHRSN